MIREFSLEYVPSAHDAKQAADMVDRMFEDGLVAFVLPNASEDEDNRFGILELLAQKGLPKVTTPGLISRRRQLTDDLRTRSQGPISLVDIPMHTDMLQTEQLTYVISIRMLQGAALGHLFRQADAYTEAGKLHRAGHREAHQLFVQGLVDTDLMEPVENSALLVSGSELIMRYDLFHYIESIVLPRKSLIRGVHKGVDK